ncbi:unnamed protein product [Rotaria sp. Silwood2]|nr:unnamed protein product [Rotaria sp. Silwood2]CAF4482663.1 unnamed protein product [Rotaria sp. Silwood2]
MLYSWCFRHLLLSIILGNFNVQYTIAIWPLSNVSNIQVLGLFQDIANTSKPTELSVHSRAMFKAAVVLSQQYNIKIDEQYIGWKATQTGGNRIGALSSTCLIMSTSNIVGIIGPTYSREAHIIAEFAKSVRIPVISYGATNPDLSDRNSYPAFYRTVPSDTAAASSIVQLFVRFNWTSSIIIYQNDEFGSGGVEAISHAFSKNKLIVSQTLIFDIATQSIRGDLTDLLSSSSTRIVLLWVETNYTPLVIKYALDCNVLGPQFTWILRSSISLDFFNQTSYPNLIGILSIEPVAGNIVNAPINTSLLNSAYSIWQQYEPETFPGPMKVNYYALFTFDATWALIQSLKQFCSTYTNHSSFCISIVNSSFCYDRLFLNGNSFYNTISLTEFLGVSGSIKFSTNVTDRIDGVYYVIQNIQSSVNGLYFVPVLQWSQSNNWKTYSKTDIIVWPGNSLKSPTGFAGLAGVNLKICVIEALPFTIQTDFLKNNTIKLTGYVPDLIDILKNKMGFIPNIILSQSNQTYNGLVQAVANGVCDLVVGDVTITAARREIVDFSNSIFDNSLRIIIRKSNSIDVDFFSYLRPFSVTLWLTLLAGFIYAAILLCLLERQDNEALKNKSIISSISMSMWYSVGTIMGYGADFHVQTAAGRVLSVGLYMLSLVLVATYTANLASDLTISKSKDFISGIDDIKNGKLSFNRIGILAGSSLEDFYLHEISCGSRNFYPLKSQNEIYIKLLDKTIDVAISDAALLEYVTKKIYCNLTLVGIDFSRSSYGIVIPKQWLYAKDLDVVILSLRESGVLDDLKRKWFEGNLCLDSFSSDKSTSINVGSMSGLLVTFGIITILSLILFAWTKKFFIKKFQWISSCQKNHLFDSQVFHIRHSIKTFSKHKNNSQTTLYDVTRF